MRDRAGGDDAGQHASATGGSGRESYGRRDYNSSGSSYRGGYRGGGSSRGGSRYDRGRGGYDRGRDYSRNFNSAGAGAGAGAGMSSGSGEHSFRSKSDRNYDNSVFIGNVPFDATPRDIESIFKGEFEIVRADIVTKNGRSRGMATVEFKNKDGVTNAINKYDHSEFQGREIFVRQDYPPPEKKLFERDGDKGGRSGRGERGERGGRGGYNDSYNGRGREAGAGGAYSGYGGRGGRGGYGNDRGGYGGRAEYKPPPPPATPGTEVFVGNLPFSVNWQALKDLMREAGQVIRADVRLDDWGRSRGFGTVVFATPEEADKAVNMFQGYSLDGRVLDTRHGRSTAVSTGERFGGAGGFRQSGERNTEFTEGVTGGNEEPSETIFVENLPFSTQNDDLFDLFETVGRVTKAEIQYQADGRASGNAVVQFELAELSDKAIQELNDYEYGGRRLQISYAHRPNASSSTSSTSNTNSTTAAAAAAAGTESTGGNDDDNSNADSGGFEDTDVVVEDAPDNNTADPVDDDSTPVE